MHMNVKINKPCNTYPYDFQQMVNQVGIYEATDGSIIIKGFHHGGVGQVNDELNYYAHSLIRFTRTGATHWFKNLDEAKSLRYRPLNEITITGQE